MSTFYSLVARKASATELTVTKITVLCSRFASNARTWATYLPRSSPYAKRTAAGFSANTTESGDHTHRCKRFGTLSSFALDLINFIPKTCPIRQFGTIRDLRTVKNPAKESYPYSNGFTRSSAQFCADRLKVILQLLRSVQTLRCV